MSENWVEVARRCTTDVGGPWAFLKYPNIVAGDWTSSPVALAGALNKMASRGNVVTNFSHLAIVQDQSTPPLYKRYRSCALAVLSFTRSTADVKFRVEPAQKAVLTEQDLSVGWLQLRGSLYAVIRRNPKVRRFGVRVEGSFRKITERGSFSYLLPPAENFRSPQMVVQTLDELAKRGTTATSVATLRNIDEDTPFGLPRFQVTAWGLVGWMQASGYRYQLREIDRPLMSLAADEVGVGVVDLGGPPPSTGAHVRLVTRRPL